MFNDYFDVCDVLLKLGYGFFLFCYVMGGSVGGMLMGVVINVCFELFYGVIVQVLFVDVVIIMFDELIFFIIGEFEEWGNLQDL